MRSPLRGHIWLVDLGEPIGHEAAFIRPALVVSEDQANRHGLVIACPITSTARGYPSHVEIEPGRSGLDGISYIQAEQVRTISSARLTRRVGAADAAAMAAVERCLQLLLRL